MDEVALGMEDIIQPLFKLFSEQDETKRVRHELFYVECHCYYYYLFFT